MLKLLIASLISSYAQAFTNLLKDFGTFTTYDPDGILTIDSSTSVLFDKTFGVCMSDDPDHLCYQNYLDQNLYMFETQLDPVTGKHWLHF
jgi:hypothetical protein